MPQVTQYGISVLSFEVFLHQFKEHASETVQLFEPVDNCVCRVPAPSIAMCIINYKTNVGTIIRFNTI